MVISYDVAILIDDESRAEAFLADLPLRTAATKEAFEKFM
jgi:hypothetical protein